MIDSAETLLERLPLVSYMLHVEPPSATVYVSPKIEEILGIERDAFADDDEFWVKQIHPEDRQRFREAFDGLRETGSMVVEYRVRSGPGTTLWVRDTASVEDGTVNGYLVDITREKELEEELALERATLDAFFARSRIGLGITDEHNRYVRVNEALARLNGGSPGDFIGRTLEEVRPELAAVVDPLREDSVDSPEHHVDVRFANGSVHALLSYFPFEVAGERYVGRAVIDVTEQRRAQQAEEEYRRLIEQLPLVVYVNETEPRHRARFVSPQIETLTGYTVEEFLSDQTLSDKLIHPDDLADVVERERGGDVFEHEYRIVRKDGEIRWVLDRMELVRDADGEPLYEQGFLVDVTDRHDTEELLRAVWEESLDAMVIADEHGNYIDANPAACQLFGRTRDVLLTSHVDEVFPPGTWRDYSSSGVSAREYTLTRPDGRELILESASKADVVPGLHFAVLRDVTRRRELEAEIWRAQKLESVGRLAGGVAHDFNNLLTAIRGYAQLLGHRVAPGSVEQQHAQEIDRVAERAAALTAQLLALGRRQTLRVRPLDLNRYLEDSVDALAERAGPRTELVFELAPGLRAVRADPRLLAEAFGSIVGNAGEAMPDGGRVLVRTRNEEVSDRDDLADGRYVVCCIQDTGPGIDAASLEHLFEPFFTTKEVGEGSGGLGLASAYGTVRQSGGTIVAESELGVGTTFSIYLPEAVADDAGNGDGESILVVERDPAVRDVAFELLTDAAYRVLTARTTAEAVRLAESYDGGIDLLLTDLDPLRERALLELLRVQRPGLQELTLAKPYTPARLRAAVQSALASPERGRDSARNA